MEQCRMCELHESRAEMFKRAAEVRQKEIDRLETKVQTLGAMLSDRDEIEVNIPDVIQALMDYMPNVVDALNAFKQGEIDRLKEELEEARATCNGAREYIQQLEAAKGPAMAGRVTVMINKTVTTRAILTDVPVEELSRLDGEILEINHMPGSCYCSEHRRVHWGSCPECKCPGCDLTNKECDEAGGCIPY